MLSHEVMTAALRYHQEGRLSEAERLYRQVLAEDPRQADAHHLLGVLLLARGEAAPALECFQRAIGLHARVAVYHKNLGRAFAALKRPTEAAESCRRALSLEPDLAEAQFHSLQIGEPAPPGTLDFTVHLTDFAETAAYLCELDLIISADTALVHLAGALGRPVWTLLSFVPDWRWGFSGETTPWYPAMRLFRQPRFGDWQSVIGRAVRDLGAGRFTEEKSSKMRDGNVA